MSIANAGEKPPRRADQALSAHPAQNAGSDATTVKVLRCGVGVIGILLPIALILGNWIVDWKVSWPSSMSGSYYTHTRNVFVGLLCALGVFLIFYWPTLRQGLFTCFAGVCALLVAFAPTAPAAPPAPKTPTKPPKVPTKPPKVPTEPAWINYLHHSAAGGLIFTLGLFCLVIFFAQYQHVLKGKEVVAHLKAWPRSFKLWWRSAVDSLRQHPLSRSSLYIICGLLILVAGALALYTGVWPAEAGWSAGWSSLYVFETVAVWAFGVAWIVASFEKPIIIQEQVAAVTARTYERRYGAEDDRTVSANANLDRIRTLLGLPGCRQQGTHRQSAPLWRPVC